MSTMPNPTDKTVLETKYGNTMSAIPHANGTTARCFLPYMTNPIPIDPRSKPKKSEDALIEMSPRPVAVSDPTIAPTVNISVGKRYSK